MTFPEAVEVAIEFRSEPLGFLIFFEDPDFEMAARDLLLDVLAADEDDTLRNEGDLFDSLPLKLNFKFPIVQSDGLDWIVASVHCLSM